MAVRRRAGWLDTVLTACTAATGWEMARTRECDGVSWVMEEWECETAEGTACTLCTLWILDGRARRPNPRAAAAGTACTWVTICGAGAASVRATKPANWMAIACKERKENKILCVNGG